MSKKEAKKIHMPIWEKIGIVLFVIVLLSVCGIVGALFATQFKDEVDKQGTPEIEVTSSITKSYYNGSDTIVAVLKYKDGHVSDDVFTFESSNPAVLKFATSTSGKFTVIDENYRGDINIEISSSIDGVANVKTTISIIEPPQYAITLNYNGATSGADIIEPIPVWSGQPVDANKLPHPELDSYIFDGWYPILSDGTLDTSHIFNAEEAYFWGRSLTLQARFKSKLILENMGEETNFQNYDKYIYYNENLPFNLPVLEQKDGWTFKGWFTEEAGNGTEYTGNSDCFLASSAHLYAKWEGQIIFNTSFEFDPDISTSDIKVIYKGEIPSLPEITYNIDGTFKGWYTQQFGLGDKVTEGETYNSNSLELFDKIEFKISLDYQDATNKNEKPFCTATYGRSLHDIGETLPKPEKDDWTFKGWYTSINGNTQVNESYKYELNDSITLYAKWEGIVELKAYIDDSLNDSVYVNYKGNLDLPVKNKQGSWTFSGWYTLPGGDGLRVSNVSEYAGKGNLTLYAKWVILSVSLDFVNVESNTSTITSLTNIVYGKTIAEQGQSLPTLDQVSRRGYTFTGWYNSKTPAQSDNPIDFNETTHYPLSMYTLYIQWSGQEILVTLDNNEGMGGTTKVTAVMGESMPTNNVSQPSKSNWIFAGYFYYPNYPSLDDGVKYYSGSMTSAHVWDIPEDTTLYAYWVENLYLVQWLDYNGTYLSEDYVQEGIVPVYSGPEPTRISTSEYSYTFNGWSPNIVTVSGNATYTAQYTATRRSYTVTWTNYDGATLESNTYLYGSTPSYSGSTPTKAADSSYTYAFSGWTPEITKVTSDVTYQATFTPTAIPSGNEGGGGGNCIITGTLITLADGSQIPVEQLKGDELLLVWNLYTGQFDVAPILFVAHQSESSSLQQYDVIYLYFDDGTSIGIVGQHGFWDFDLNKYVFVNNENAYQFIGHSFGKQNLNELEDSCWTSVKVVDIKISIRNTNIWSPITYGHLCYYANDLLVLPGLTDAFVNIFKVDSQTMSYDETMMASDIEQYGLFTYEEFVEYLYIPEVVFNAFNAKYLKVAFGKGIITWDTIINLVANYSSYIQFT